MNQFDRDVIACRKCPRLIAHSQEIASIKRRAYQDWEYWGQPVPSFGPVEARLLIIGLAPGAHGANRTGRVFTGDSSGSLLYAVLHATGFATQPESVSRDDDLRLIDARITCAAHCAPPGNKPLPSEIRNCGPWLEREIAMMTQLRVVVTLGHIAFESYVRLVRCRKKLLFAHNCEHFTGPGEPALISSYHPSQQNTSTGKLTETMFRAVFERARGRLGLTGFDPAPHAG